MMPFPGPFTTKNNTHNESKTRSYGFQDDLKKMQCTPEEIADIDFDLAKLAARGIAIIVASGDAGSGMVGSEVSASLYVWPLKPLVLV